MSRRWLDGRSGGATGPRSVSVRSTGPGRDRPFDVIDDYL